MSNSNADSIFDEAIEGTFARNDYQLQAGILLDYISTQDSDEAFSHFLAECKELRSLDATPYLG